MIDVAIGALAGAVIFAGGYHIGRQTTIEQLARDVEERAITMMRKKVARARATPPDPPTPESIQVTLQEGPPPR